MKNNLTEKDFWSENWKKLNLPARFFNDYSHEILSRKIDKYIKPEYKSFLEVGGCPGRWAEYFFTRHSMKCDSMDYDENNIAITKRNYEMLGIQGDVFFGDIISNNTVPEKLYDVVLSDGLVEHFTDSSEVFKNHVKYLKKEGLLIVGVPNIKKSWFYDYFSQYDKESYVGYRHVSKEELLEHARKNNLDVLYCDFIGVFNIGLINTSSLNSLFQKVFIINHLFFQFIFRCLNIVKESKVFSPYIYLIAKKHE